jgi:hypothetical protein
MRDLQGFFAIVFLIVISSCAKEYSFEGANPRPAMDTVRLPPPPPSYDFPVCSFCNSLPPTPDLWTWSFKMENVPACGKADTAIVLNDRTVFTFFGPSSCSGDTGMVITVYLQNDTLNRDIRYLSTNKVSFFYYDRVTPSYIFMSQVYSPFSLSLENYNHQTRIATGKFEGSALRSDGHWVSINSGRFKVKLL